MEDFTSLFYAYGARSFHHMKLREALEQKIEANLGFKSQVGDGLSD
jgi:hypothetical protein